jgi:glucose-6-phosphate isomerase
MLVVGAPHMSAFVVDCVCERGWHWFPFQSNSGMMRDWLDRWTTYTTKAFDDDHGDDSDHPYISSNTNTTNTTATMASSSTTTTTTADQAWAILRRHARDEVSHLRLRELCRSDERVSALVSVYNADHNNSQQQQQQGRMMMVDLSRQFLTLETVNKLLFLSTARGIPKRIRRLAWGPYSSSKTAAVDGIPPSSSVSAMPSSSFPKKPTTQSQQRSSSSASAKDKENETTSSSSSFPSYHLSLRAPQGRGLVMLDSDGRTNVLTRIHNDWHRIQRLAESLRRGQLAGVNGHMIRDVIVVGKGTPVMMLRFVYLALCKDAAATIGRRAGMNNSNAQRRIKFLTTCDPVRAAAVVADSDPGATLVVTLAMSSSSTTTTLASNQYNMPLDGDEVSVASRTLQTWLLSHLGQDGRRSEDSVLKKHMMWVTSNDVVASQHKPECVFVIPSHSRTEPFSSFTAASLLPLSIVFGWSIVEQLLAGAHDMDCHFVDTNPRHNLPVLLALTDVWNDACFPDGTAEAGPIGSSTSNGNRYGGGAAGRIVTPYTEAFAAYPAFVATLESQTCGRNSANLQSESRSLHPPSPSLQTCAPIIIDGGLHGMYDRSTFQSSKILPSELVMTLDSQLASNSDPKLGINQVNDAQDALICSLFAHADELAFGSHKSSSENVPPSSISFNLSTTKEPASILSDAWQQRRNGEDVNDLTNDMSGNGNRPSTLLLCDKLDAFACGQLVAMAEHRALVKAWIWDIDPFVLDVGTSIRSTNLGRLQTCLQRMVLDGPEYADDGIEENDADLNLSTRTILRHYADMISRQRYTK